MAINDIISLCITIFIAICFFISCRKQMKECDIKIENAEKEREILIEYLKDLEKGKIEVEEEE